MSTSPLKPLKSYIISPKLKHTATIIFMHGLGDTSHGWSSTFNEISNNFKYIKFILPTAKINKVTIFGGERTTSWYDLTNNDIRDSNNNGIDISVSLIQKIIDNEISSGTTSSKIMLGGFSQGGSMSLYTGYSQIKPLAGIMCLSGYLPNRDIFKPSIETLNTPTFCYHGDCDNVVPKRLNDLAIETLKYKGAKNIDRKIYPGLEHSCSDEELQDMQKFIFKCLPPS